MKDPEKLNDEHHQLQFDVEKSIRYQHRRQSHYESFHRWLMFFIIMFGSSAFTASIDHPGFPDWLVGLPEWFGLASAALAAVDLVWGLSHKARDHQLLRKKFSELAAEIEERGSEIDSETINAWRAKRIRIESDEPPTFWAVEHDCANEVAVAWGHNDHYVPLPLRKRLLMNWLRFDHADPPAMAST